MIRKNEDANLVVVENVAGGNGKIYKNILVDAPEMYGLGRMVAKIVLKKGCSIGDHPHTSDAELYYILEGEAVVTDNDSRVVLHKGDAVFTGNGNRHSITNMSDEDVVFLAVIIGK